MEKITFSILFLEIYIQILKIYKNGDNKYKHNKYKNTSIIK